MFHIVKLKSSNILKQPSSELDNFMVFFVPILFKVAKKLQKILKVAFLYFDFCTASFKACEIIFVCIYTRHAEIMRQETP